MFDDGESFLVFDTSIQMSGGTLLVFVPNRSSDAPTAEIPDRLDETIQSFSRLRFGVPSFLGPSFLRLNEMRIISEDDESFVWANDIDEVPDEWVGAASFYATATGDIFLWSVVGVIAHWCHETCQFTRVADDFNSWTSLLVASVTAGGDQAVSRLFW